MATSGTAAAIRALHLPCEDVEAITDFPPLLGGRVKTLHPKVFGGILARPERADDASDKERQGIPTVAVVVVNLYRFAEAAARPQAREDDVIEQIDVGGVALLRAAAKNYEHVSVLAEPGLYPEFIAALARGGTSVHERRRLAARAFALVAEYDDAIASYFAGRDHAGLPDVLSLNLPLRSRLRYGENPWARAAFYHGEEKAFPQALSGKMLSYNNMLDVDSCLRLIAPISEPDGFPADAAARKPILAAIVKHTVPCGLAGARTSKDALEAALGADPISAFGGIVALSDRLDVQSAELLRPRFLEVVAAPEFDDAALELLRAKKNLRLLRFNPELPAQLLAGTTVRSALGGVLAEQPDPAAPPDAWTAVSERRPDLAGVARSALRLRRRAPGEIQRSRRRARSGDARRVRWSDQSRGRSRACLPSRRPGSKGRRARDRWVLPFRRRDRGSDRGRDRRRRGAERVHPRCRSDRSRAPRRHRSRLHLAPLLPALTATTSASPSA